MKIWCKQRTLKQKYQQQRTGYAMKQPVESYRGFQSKRQRRDLEPPLLKAF